MNFFFFFIDSIAFFFKGSLGLRWVFDLFFSFDTFLRLFNFGLGKMYNEFVL